MTPIMEKLLEARRIFGGARLERSDKGVTWRVLDEDEWESAWAALDAIRDLLNAPRTTHPMQPVVLDEVGVFRFKENAIVCALLDTGTLDMNKIAWMNFSREDREQFAQLIGYSLAGASELQYVSDELLERAEAERQALATQGEQTK